MDNLIPGNSQRPVDCSKTPSPASALVAVASPQKATLTALWEAHEVPAVHLVRSREGRSLSRARLRRAEEFMLTLDAGAPGDWQDFLYGAGIVTQLALSSHLLDVGFSDAWCARHIGLYVARSLAYANASGLGLECPEMVRLAQVLTPYSKWNWRFFADCPRPHDDGFTQEKVRALLHKLMSHLGCVTGHRISRARVRRENLVKS